MRDPLKTGTWIGLPDNSCYEIAGDPIGEGGLSLVYPVIRQVLDSQGHYHAGRSKFALKECYPNPLSLGDPPFVRTPSGQIVPGGPSERLAADLLAAQRMQFKEQQITEEIYATSSRLTPVIGGASQVRLSFDKGQTFVTVQNTVTVMGSLADKGQALSSYLSGPQKITLLQAFRVTEQILFAVREVHRAGYIHLDLQDTNIFIHGALTESSSLATLIDLGSARKLLEDGRCPAIPEAEAVFATQAFAAPEIRRRHVQPMEAKTGDARQDVQPLRLGTEADIYSIGALLLLLLTGKRPEPEAIYAHKGGRHLTRAQLKSLKCPAHLAERMQQILAKALENDPEGRYHSCDEMLAELSDFTAALMPYRSDLSQVAYDAFICYKHGPIDSRAAVALQKGLEHFPVPRDLRKEQTKICRVFVDEGELSSCADMGLQITEALKNAGFLIVICSPETRTSPWVNEEIDTFLRFHDRSRILPVMTGGEPKDTFPNALLKAPEQERLARRRPGRHVLMQSRTAGSHPAGQSHAADGHTPGQDQTADDRTPGQDQTADDLPDGQGQAVDGLPAGQGQAVDGLPAGSGHAADDLPAGSGHAADDLPQGIAPASRETVQDGLAAGMAMAADARGKDLRTVLKKIKKDALLRIAAPMLGTTYDSLKQRHKTYRMQKLAALALTAFLILAAFTAQTLRQSAQIRKQYQQARINQARYLSRLSQELLAQGDREKALLTALAVGPENDADGAVVPEQMYALNKALTSYKDGYGIRYDPAFIGEAEKILSGTLSADGTCYLAIDGDQNAVILSCETGKKLFAVTPAMVKDQIDDPYLYHDLYPYQNEDLGGIRLILPLSGHRAAIVLDHSIAVVDLETQNICRSFPMDIHLSLGSTAYAQKDRLFACGTTDGQLYVVDLEDGRQIAHADLGQVLSDSAHTYTVESLSIHEDQNTIALGLSYQTTDRTSGPGTIPGSGPGTAPSDTALPDTVLPSGTTPHDPAGTSAQPAGLLLYRCDDRQVQILSADQTEKVLWTDASHVAAIHFTDPVSGNTQIDIGGALDKSYRQALYAVPSGRLLSEGETTTIRPSQSIGLAAAPFRIDKDTFQTSIAWIRGKLTVLDNASGRALVETTYRSDISGVSAYGEGRLLVSLNNGTVQYINALDRVRSREVLSLSTETSGFSYDPEGDRIILLSGDKALFCDSTHDPGMKELPLASLFSSDTAPQGVVIEEGTSGYAELAGEVFRYLGLQQPDQRGFDTTALLVFPVPEGSDRWIYRYASPGPDYSIGNIGFGYDPETGLRSVAFTERSPDGRSIFRKADLFTGEELIHADITDYDPYNTYDSHRVVYTPHMDAMFLKKSLGILRFDLSGDALRTDGTWIADGQEIGEMTLSGDGGHLAFIAEDLSSGKYALYSYGLETGMLAELAVCEGSRSAAPIAPSDPDAEGSVPMIVSDLDHKGSFLVCGRVSPRLCFYDGKETLYILDQKASVIRSVIHTGVQDSLTAAFFDQDQYLVTASRDTVRLYDLETGQILHSYTFPDADRLISRKIVTDSSCRYFGVKTNSYYESDAYDPGTNRRPLSIFYVDDRHIFYPYADVDHGYASFAGGEVSAMDSSRFSYSGFYDYPGLKEKALRILDDRTLSEEEAVMYFIQQADR